MVNDEFDGEINDKEKVLQLSKFSTLLLLHITENIQKDSEFYRRAVKFNGMTIECDVFDVCEKETILDALKKTNGFRFLNNA